MRVPLSPGRAGRQLPDRFQISISTMQTLALEWHSTAPDRGCVKTPDCNGRRESISTAPRDLRANSDFSSIENVTSPGAALVDRAISSFRNCRPRFYTASALSRHAPSWLELAGRGRPGSVV
jgi:hypothetical protein